MEAQHAPSSDTNEGAHVFRLKDFGIKASLIASWYDLAHSPTSGRVHHQLHSYAHKESAQGERSV